MLHLIKESKMNKKLYFIQLFLMILFVGCKSIKINSIRDYSPNLIEQSLENSFTIINKESIVPDKLFKAINKARKHFKKYRFGEPGEDMNAHFTFEDELSNQVIVQAGKSNNGVIIILYDTATAGGIMRRFLIIKKVDTHLYKIYDDCASPKVEKIEELKIKSNRCH